MLRLQPTTIFLVMADIKEYETRRKYRKYLEKGEETSIVLQQKDETQVPKGLMSSPMQQGKAHPLVTSDRSPLATSPPQSVRDAFSDEESLTPKIPRRATSLQLPTSHDGADTSFESPSTPRYPSLSSRQSAASSSVYGHSSQERPPTRGKAPQTSELSSQGETRGEAQSHHHGRMVKEVLLELSDQWFPHATHIDLPAPFSQTPRNVSQGTSPSLSREGESSRPAAMVEASPATTPARHPASARHSNSPSSIVRTAVRFIGARIGSSSSQSSSPPSLVGHRGQSSPGHEPYTSPAGPPSPSPVPVTPRVRIYNDSLPASSQPQTPEQLPEARHRSRFAGSYTAPVTRSRAARAAGQTSVTPGRQHRRRSPAGLDSPGMRGLYGGSENNGGQ